MTLCNCRNGKVSTIYLTRGKAGYKIACGVYRFSAVPITFLASFSAETDKLIPILNKIGGFTP